MSRLRFGWICALTVLVIGAHVAPSQGEDSSPAARVVQLYEKYKQKDFPGIPDFTARQAMSLADSLDFVILDVRAPKERKVSILPGSVDRRSFESHREDWKDRPVLVYCTIGYRSGLTTKKLREDGVEAYNLVGGILGWVNSGGPVVDGQTGEETHRIHVYGRQWNLLPAGWKGVW